MKHSLRQIRKRRSDGYKQRYWIRRNYNSVPISKSKIITLYHGTTPKKAENIIKKQVLFPQPQSIDPHISLISLTGDPRIAEEHVRMRRGEKPVVLRIDVPVSRVQKAIVGGEDWPAWETKAFPALQSPHKPYRTPDLNKIIAYYELAFEEPIPAKIKRLSHQKIFKRYGKNET